MTSTAPQPVITYRQAEVRAVTRPTPRTVRVTLGGDELDDLPVVAPDGYLKLFFPQPGQDGPVLPEPPADGDVGAWYKRYLVMPDDVRPPMRTYTVRSRRDDPRTGACEFDVDFVLHDGGRGDAWARAAQPGDRLAFTGPYGLYAPRPEHDWVLLVGDEAAVPAMCAIVEASGATGDRPEEDTARPIVALAEVNDQAEHRDWADRPTLRATWLSTPTSSPSRMVDVLRHLTDELPPGRPYVWLAGEASLVKSLRRLVVGELGIARHDVCFTGYWRRGKTEEQAAVEAMAAIERGEDPEDI